MSLTLNVDLNNILTFLYVLCGSFFDFLLCCVLKVTLTVLWFHVILGISLYLSFFNSKMMWEHKLIIALTNL